jgi:hypothetical protein
MKRVLTSAHGDGDMKTRVLKILKILRSYKKLIKEHEILNNL